MIHYDYKETEPIYRVGFFDFWHYEDIDTIVEMPSKKTSEKINERIRMQEIIKEFPEHFSQLIPLLD